MNVVKISDKLQQALVEGQASSCKPLFKSETITDNCRGNVIPISAVGRSVSKRGSIKSYDEKFKYPMLECL